MEAYQNFTTTKRKTIPMNLKSMKKKKKLSTEQIVAIVLIVIVFIGIGMIILAFLGVFNTKVPPVQITPTVSTSG